MIMKYTENYKLKMPEGNDYVSVDDFNENFNAVDKELAQQKSDFTEHKEHGVNNNILINSNFANPVNQRGKTTYNAITGNAEYTIDRWNTFGTSAYPTDVIVSSDYVRFSTKMNASGFVQKVEFPEKYRGKKLTLSAEFSNIAGNLSLVIADGVDASQVNIVNDGVYEFTHIVASNATLLQVYVKNVSANGSVSSCDIKWMKLEIGDHATPYVPRLYAEELALCRWYYSTDLLHDAIAVRKETDNLAFEKVLGKMRLERPTVTLKNCGIRNNYQEVGDFTFTADSFNEFVDIYCDKTNHGLVDSHTVQVIGTVIRDAEL